MKLNKADYQKPEQRKLKSVPKPPHFECRYIPHDGFELRESWNFVKPGLEDLIARARPEGFYTVKPEDVYVRLRSNMASLYVTYLDGVPRGWGIAYKQNDPFLNVEPHLLSWLGWSDSRECRDRYFQALETLALSMKLKEIRHHSTRKGWILSPPGAGWEILTSTGWRKIPEDHATRRAIYHAFEIPPEITMRKVVINGL